MTRTSSSLWSFCCCFSLCLCCCCCCCCNELCCLGLDGTDMSQGRIAVSPLWYWTLPVTIDESGNKRQQNFIIFVSIWFNYMSCWYDDTATMIWGKQSVTVWHWSCTWGAHSRSQTDCKPAKTGNPFVIPNPAQHMHRRAKQHRNILTSEESGENSSRLPSSLYPVSGGLRNKYSHTHFYSHSFKFNCVEERHNYCVKIAWAETENIPKWMQPPPRRCKPKSVSRDLIWLEKRMSEWIIGVW